MPQAPAQNFSFISSIPPLLRNFVSELRQGFVPRPSSFLSFASLGYVPRSELRDGPPARHSKFSSISAVIRVRSYSGFQPQSARATESSMLCGQLSAIFCR
jgi:hypothetical protein